nr:hypothetical protein [Sinorhizobium meliloti]
MQEILRMVVRDLYQSHGEVAFTAHIKRLEEGAVDSIYVSAVSAPLDRLYFEAGWACEKVSRTIWRFAWQVMDLLGATKLSSRAAETDVGRML